MTTRLETINKLLFPNVLGYYSENNGGGFVAVNNKLTQYRGFESRKWSPWKVTNPNTDNRFLEIVTDPNRVTAKVFEMFIRDERLNNIAAALKIVDLCLPFFLGLRDDPQGQCHYCLMKTDPMEGIAAEKVVYLFPGTQFDLTDSLPESDNAIASPMVGGSLGWLSSLELTRTLDGIRSAKKILSSK